MSTADTLVHGMDVDLSEKHVVTACADSMVRIYRLENTAMNLVAELQGHVGAVTKAIFINVGELIASSDFSGNLILWKLENNGFIKRASIQASNGPIYDISHNFDGTSLKIYCGCDGGILKTIEFDTSFNHKEESKEVHRYGVSSVSANSEAVITGGFDFSVGVHTTDGSEYMKDHHSAVNSVAIAPSNFTGALVFASCEEDGKVFVYEQRNKSFVKQEINIGEPCHSLSWSRAGFVLTVGYGHGSFKSFMPGETGKYEELSMKNIE